MHQSILDLTFYFSPLFFEGFIFTEKMERELTKEQEDYLLEEAREHIPKRYIGEEE